MGHLPFHRSPDQLLRSAISYCEYRAGSSWRNLADPAQRHDPDRWDWLDAAKLCESARYSSRDGIALVLPDLNSQPSPSPLINLLSGWPRGELVTALMELDPTLTDRRLLSRLAVPKLARMLADRVLLDTAGTGETMAKNNPAARGGPGMTYDEIAAALEISRARVQQLEKSALAKLRKRPQSVTFLAALSGELDRMRSARRPVQSDFGGEDAA